MENEITFKEVIDYIKENDPKLTKSADHLLGIVLICSPFVFGPVALPALGLIGVKDQLIKTGDKILSIFTTKKKDDYFERSNRMKMAYCIIHYTAFLEAVERILPEIKTAFQLNLSDSKFFSELIANESHDKIKQSGKLSDDESSGLDRFRINMPHPIDKFDFQNEKIQKLYQYLSKGFNQLIIKAGMWESLDAKSRALILKRINALPEMALKCFSAQYFKLAASFEEFYIWSNLNEYDQTKKLLTSQTTYLNKLLKISDEKSNYIDIGLKKIEAAINSIPAEIETRKTNHIIESLRKKYKDKIQKTIIDEDRINEESISTLSFPKKIEIFIPQAFRILQIKNKNVNLEEETSWVNSSRKTKLGLFIFRFLSTPYSTQDPLLILGHPGSGKSLLTEILAAKLISPFGSVIRLELRNINPENEIFAQIEEQILKDTHEDVSWASFRRQLNDKPTLIILDGFDELLQIHGKMFFNYINKVRSFQREEAVLGRPLQVIITSRITLIDKVDIPLETTVIKLEGFDRDQRNSWVNIWNKTNQKYFIEKRISPFKLPNDDRIIAIGEQPLLLLMLAIYDSEKNQLKKEKGLDQTVLYYSLLRRFIHRQNEKSEHGGDYKSLSCDDQKQKIDIDFQKLGVAAIGMHNRGTLFILKDQLQADLNFFNLETNRMISQDRNYNQADILLGSFFFVYESISLRRGEKSDAGQKNSAYEFLHNTFGEFLFADFVLRRLLEEIHTLLILRNNKALHTQLHQKLENFDGFSDNWYSCLMHSALHSKPNILKMMKEWLPHFLAQKKFSREDFLSGFDKIIYCHLNMFLTKNIFPTIMMLTNQTPFPRIPILGYIANYTLNLIVMRSILSKNDYVLNEELIETYSDVTQPWERLTYLWRSWFSTENLKGLTAIMSAKRTKKEIIIRQNNMFITSPQKELSSLSNEDESKSLVDVANTLGDSNVTDNIRGLLAYAALGVSIDVKSIDDLERKFQQSQKMQAIGTLAGGVAHDFNNILSVILGYAELTINIVEKGTPIEGYLKEISTAGDRAKNLVQQILTFARQSDAEVKTIQVDTIIKEAVKFIRSSIPATIEIKQNISSNALIMGNATQIHQVLMNLCTNAAHAMKDDGGILDLSLKDVVIDRVQMGLKPGKYIEIKVSDTGTGIAPEIIGSIFEPYFTTKGPGEGTGLGLSVAHGIIESYGGKITVISEPEKGTSFDVFIPVIDVQVQVDEKLIEELHSKNERILFVDDEISISRLGEILLSQMGYRVIACNSGLDALNIFKSKPKNFDLIITDITMPNITGDKLAIEVNKIRPNIPIIFCSEDDPYFNKKLAKKIGINEIISKPFSKLELTRVVRRVLDTES